MMSQKNKTLLAVIKSGGQLHHDKAGTLHINRGRAIIMRPGHAPVELYLSPDLAVCRFMALAGFDLKRISATKRGCDQVLCAKECRQ